MRSILLSSFLVFVQWLVPAIVVAQYGKEYFHYNDKIVLRTNQIIFGQLIDYTGDSIRIEMKSGSQVKFLRSQVKNVTQYSIKAEKQYKHGGHYVAIGNGLMFGNQKEESPQSKGFEISVVYKYFKNKYHVFLAGAGYESYNIDIPIVHLPLIIGYEYHVPFSAKNSLFLGIRTGYTLVSASEVSSARVYEAGWHLNPSFGLLFKITPKMGLFAETGFKFQRANHTFDQSWWRTHEEGLINRRYFLRIGMIF